MKEAFIVCFQLRNTEQSREYQVLFPRTYHEISAMLVFTKWVCTRFGQRSAWLHKIIWKCQKIFNIYRNKSFDMHNQNKINSVKYFTIYFFTWLFLENINLVARVSPVTTAPEIRHIFVYPSPEGPCWESFAPLPVKVFWGCCSVIRRRLLRKQVSKHSLPTGVSNITFSSLGMKQPAWWKQQKL